MNLEKIFISPESNYYKHKFREPGNAPTFEPQKVECHKGKGLVGDRFYNYKDDFKGQVSLISTEGIDKLANDFNININPKVLRRNLLVSGFDPLEFIGKEFQIGEVRFLGVEDCTPCKWMNFVIHEEAKAWLDQHSKGGLRAKVLTSGFINIGDQIILNT